MTRQPDLPAIEPKPRRQMLKPRKAELYARVDAQDGELVRLRAEVERLATENESLRAAPLWRRLTRKRG